LRDGQEALIETLDDWYRENNVNGQFMIEPSGHTPALGQALARRGYVQSDFSTALYGLPQTWAAASGGIEISEVQSAQAMEHFLDALLAGWSIPEQYREGSKENMRLWRGVPDWRLYLARIDGRPAAAGKLFLHDRVGFFCDASTRPEFRGRGLQSALLRHCSAVASAAGVELVYSQAKYGSTSHRNMERVGLRVLHTAAIWTRA
jgi:ribosomal protein S18 acetylase RimI-like enzyme